MTRLLAVLDRHFAERSGFLRFAARVLALSCAGLSMTAILYISSTPGFWSALLSSGTAASGLLRQLVTNGLPVVFLLNLVSFANYAELRRSDRDAVGVATIVAVELVLKLALFHALHAAIYAASARTFGSFGGEESRALAAVAPTIARSAFFENLSGVYLYATAVGAIPSAFAAALRWQKLAQGADRTHAEQGAEPRAVAWALAFAFLSFTVFAALVSGSAALVAMAQNSP